MINSTKTILSAFILLSLYTGISQQVLCQERKGLTGVGIQLSTPPLQYLHNFPSIGLGSVEMPPDILISTWVTDQLAIEPSLGLLAYTDQTNLRFGITIVNHFGHEKLTPFVLFRSKAYLTNTNGNSGSDFVFGVGVGGEYFLGDKFSVSGECQLNYMISDKQRSLFIRKNIISTGIGISGRFYLN